MLVCTKCGTENPEGTQFCRKCGGYLDWSSVKVAVQAGSAVTASLKTPDITVEPGGQATCEVEVNNDGRLVDEYRLQVSGTDPSWCSVEPPSIRLMPRTSGVARVLFRPPHASSPAAGTGPFVVIAASSADPSVWAQAAGSLTIRPFAEVSATVTPQNSQSFGVADHTVSVENRGNAAIRVSVSAQDPDNRLTCELAPPEMTVERGTVGRSQLSVRTTNPREPRNGERVAFQVSVRPAVGAAIRLDAATVLLQRPASWWSRLRIPLAAALLLVIAGGVVAYAGPPYPHWPPLPKTSPAPATPTSAGPAFDNLTVSASALDWSQSPNGTKTLNVANTAKSGVVKIVQLQIVGDSSFVIDSLTQCRIGTILQPGQSCPVVIAFNPQAKGSYSGSLSVQAEGSPPQSVALIFTPAAITPTPVSPAAPNPTPCTAATISAVPSSGATVGTVVIFTAYATGCAQPLYEYWVRDASVTDRWTMVQAYSANSTFRWNTAGLPAGTWLISAWARDASSQGTITSSSGNYDANPYLTFRLYYPFIA